MTARKQIAGLCMLAALAALPLAALLKAQEPNLLAENAARQPIAIRDVCAG